RRRPASDECPPDPFENAVKYPGVKTGARGTGAGGRTVPIGSFYGDATGIVGLRLFPNPAFDRKAAAKWSAEKYYKCSTPIDAQRHAGDCTDADLRYFGSRSLVRPYRVGMSCAFCHVGPNPVHPPREPNTPRWSD